MGLREKKVGGAGGVCSRLTLGRVPRSGGEFEGMGEVVGLSGAIGEVNGGLSKSDELIGVGAGDCAAPLKPGAGAIGGIVECDQVAGDLDLVTGPA
ncbi:MAG: hypothetical protein AAFV43_17260 [Planctomycetota bacterium]